MLQLILVKLSIQLRRFSCLVLVSSAALCGPSTLTAVEIPENFPERSASLVQRFEEDAAKTRAKAEREVNKLRDDLVASLEKEQKSVTKKGDLNEALLIKGMIEALAAEQSENSADLFGSRSVTQPRLRFVADKSMPLYPVGTTHACFPAMLTADALTVFDPSGAGIYYDQRTDIDDVVYEVLLPKPARKLNWEGSAAQNLTITVTDAKGNVLGAGGPWNGGNIPLKFSMDFKPSSEFVVVIRNNIGNWFYTKNIQFE